MPFFAEHHRTTGAGPSGLILALALESLPGPLRSAPSLRKQAALDGAIYFVFSSTSIPTVYMSLSTGVYFTSTTAGRNDWVSFSPGSIKSSACSPTCREIFFPCSTKSSACSPESFSPGTTELNFQPHQIDIRSSLQQNAQTFFTQQRSRTY